MADKSVRIFDSENQEYIDIKVTDNGDGTYSQDSSSTVEGRTSDSAVATDTTGTISGKLRGLVKIFADVWDSVNHALKVSPLPLDNTIDTITSKLATDAIMNDTTALTPKFAKIDAASSGDNTLVAAVTGKKIRVLSLYYVSAGTVTVRFESGAGGTALTGQATHAVNNQVVLPFNPVGWFETAAATLLNLELSDTVSVDGALTYVEV